MHKSILVASLALLVSCSVIAEEKNALNTGCPMSENKYPESRQVAVTDSYFGTQVVDSYLWLEDDHSPEVKHWVSE